MKFLRFSQTKLGSFLSLPAHGRAGARAIPFSAALFAKQKKTKFGGGGTPEAERFAFATGQEARAGKNSFPPTPFLFARPSDWILKFGIRIFVKKSSNINQKTPPVGKCLCWLVLHKRVWNKIRWGKTNQMIKKSIYGE